MLSAEVKAKTRQSRRQLTQNSALSTQNLSGKVGILVGGRIKYIARPGAPAEKPAAKPARPRPEKPPKSKACPEDSRRIDPKYLSAARELRDRYLEQMNSEGFALEGRGKYEISRTLSDAQASPRNQLPLLGIAA